MKRNLDERIEVLTPVADPASAHAQLCDILDALLRRATPGVGAARRPWERDLEASEPGIHASLLARAPFDLNR